MKANCLNDPRETTSCACQSNCDKLKIDSALLERILNLSKGDHEIFVELGHGKEVREIAKSVKRPINTVYVMVQRMRSKLGVKTSAMVRFEAIRYVLSGIKRQERHQDAA